MFHQQATEEMALLAPLGRIQLQHLSIFIHQDFTPPPLLRCVVQEATTLGSLEEMLQERDAQLDELKFQLLRAQQIKKVDEVKRRRDVHFNIGDNVFLKLQPYRQKSLARKHNEKLAPRYYGPYTI